MKKKGRNVQKKKKNREIMLVTWGFTVLFLVMTGYIAHYSVTQ